MVTWWAIPFDKVTGTAFEKFDQRDIVPVAYAAFAVALGVTAGVFIRRTLPAMATTFFVFIAVRVAFAKARAAQPDRTEDPHCGSRPGGNRLRSHRLRARRPRTLATRHPERVDPIRQDRRRERQGLDRRTAGEGLSADGHRSPSRSHGRQPCACAQGAKDALHDCVTKVGKTFHQVVTYQPANRYWSFQLYEFGIYIGAASCSPESASGRFVGVGRRSQSRVKGCCDRRCVARGRRDTGVDCGGRFHGSGRRAVPVRVEVTR